MNQPTGNTETNPDTMAPAQDSRPTWKKPEITVADVSTITQTGTGPFILDFVTYAGS